MQDIPQTMFLKQVVIERKKIELLETFVLPEWQKCEVNWKQLAVIAQSNKRNRWSELEVYNTMQKYKNLPAIYCFSVVSGSAEELFLRFKKAKILHSEIRKKKGLVNSGYINLSYLHQEYNGSSCIYVGSRKKNLHDRFKQHLGYGYGRTGALHLCQLFDPSEIPPTVLFYYTFLDEVYRTITEKIECVVQKALNPCIGKNILDD